LVAYSTLSLASPPAEQKDPNATPVKPAAPAKAETAAAPATAGAEIGKPAPAFALKGIDGKEYKLADLKDKVVVLEWTNHECPVVNTYHTAGTMMNTFKKFAGKPVVWLAIDSSSFAADKSEAIKKWAAEKKVEYPILLDAPGTIGKAYGAKTTPHIFIIDQKGTLAYMGAPDSQNEEKDQEKVRNYVEEAVTALLSGSTVATAQTKPYGCTVKYKKD